MSKNWFKGKHGPLLIAEIGGNHEGNFAYAKKLTQLAIDCDVDFIKFQIYTGDRLVSRVENPARNAHFKKFELSREQHRELAQMVQAAGIHYTSSVWDLDAMDWIDKYIPVYKIGSGDLTAYPILAATAQRNKPMIISTGLATEEEVVAAVEYVQQVNPIYRQKEMLAVLQCTSMYPIPASEANLSVMQRYRELTGLTIGYSDHTIGSKALAYAVAMGAEILEFHFTDTRENQTFRDHLVSLTPDEVKELIAEIQLIKTLQGSATKQPTPSELATDHVTSFRRAVYPVRDIAAGEVLTADVLTVLRPLHGIDAREYEKVVGKTAKVDLKAQQQLNWKDLK
ncbi:MAG: N-acetylneuraminate synthase [Bacteroidetes bacterium]|nr:MAG: N-acetylneuraminate synthase [Bacteroidota bacterium]